MKLQTTEIYQHLFRTIDTKIDLNIIWNALWNLQSKDYFRDDYITMETTPTRAFGSLKNITFNELGGVFDIKQQLNLVSPDSNFIRFKIINPPSPIIHMFNSFQLIELDNSTRIHWNICACVDAQYQSTSLVTNIYQQMHEDSSLLSQK